MNTKNMKFFIYFPLLLGLIFSVLPLRMSLQAPLYGALSIFSLIHFFITLS